ncbi:hypothetical protein [Streptomyces sp. NPDC048825]|uniref:hypothetical protein n=1 Tax=Streptomyces sp. NPDC048825 TaxID=3365592 RepID=UPI00371FD85A
MHPERFRLTLTSGDKSVAHGWWGDEATARRKFRDWIGEHGSIEGARVILTDEETGETLTSWPDEP